MTDICDCLPKSVKKDMTEMLESVQDVIILDNFFIGAEINHRDYGTGKIVNIGPKGNAVVKFEKVHGTHINYSSEYLREYYPHGVEIELDKDEKQKFLKAQSLLEQINKCRE